MQQVVLNNGVEMPILGYGVYRITDANECERSVCDAIQTGYRSIDTAASYLNEEAVGKGIKRSGIAREELFVTTKLWVQDAGYESTKKAFEKSLNRLQLEYLDLYLIPKSVRKERMEENFTIFDFELSPEDMETMVTLDTKVSSFFDHRDPEIVKWIGTRKLEI